MAKLVYIYNLANVKDRIEYKTTTPYFTKAVAEMHTLYPKECIGLYEANKEIRLNGILLNQDEIETLLLTDNDEVVIYHGLGLVAIPILYATLQTALVSAAASIGMYGATVATVAGLIVDASLMAISSFAVNAIMQFAFSPQKPSSSSGTHVGSPTYGWNLRTQMVAQDLPVIVGFGEQSIGGIILNQFATLRRDSKTKFATGETSASANLPYYKLYKNASATKPQYIEGSNAVCAILLGSAYNNVNNTSDNSSDNSEDVKAVEIHFDKDAFGAGDESSHLEQRVDIYIEDETIGIDNMGTLSNGRNLYVDNITWVKITGTNGFLVPIKSGYDSYFTINFTNWGCHAVKVVAHSSADKSQWFLNAPEGYIHTDKVVKYENTYLDLQLALGEGEIEGIKSPVGSNVKINNSLLNTLSDVEFFSNNGSNQQDVLPYANETTVPNDLDIELDDYGKETVLTTEYDSVEDIQLRMEFSLSKYSSTGELESVNMDFEIQYRPYDPDPNRVWNSTDADTRTIPSERLNFDGKSTTPIYKGYRLAEWDDFNEEDLTGYQWKRSTYSQGTVTVTNNKLTVTGSGTQWKTTDSNSGIDNVIPGDTLVLDRDGIPYTIVQVDSDSSIILLEPYAVDNDYTSNSNLTYIIYPCIKRKLSSYKTLIKSPNKYQVRVVRYSPKPDDSTVQRTLKIIGMDEITERSFAYPNTAVANLRIKATEELSGSIPEIMMTVRWLKVPVPILKYGSRIVKYEHAIWDDKYSNGTGAYRFCPYYSTINEYEDIDPFDDELSNTTIPSGAILDSSSTTYINFPISYVHERTSNKNTAGGHVVQWTRNPALCIYSLLTNQRWGLGAYIDSGNIDIASILSIAKECKKVVGNCEDFKIIDVGAVSKSYVTIENTTYADSTYKYKILVGTSSLNSNELTWAIIDGGSTVGTNARINLVQLETNVYWSNGSPLSIAGSASVQWGERKFELDVVLDENTEPMDLLTQLCSSFRTVPFWAEGTIKLIMDKLENPVQMITEGNIVRGSLKIAYPDQAKTPNCIEGQFINRDRDYARETRAVIDNEALVVDSQKNVLIPIKKKTINYFGITRASQVIRECEFFRRSTKFAKKAIQFKASIDSVHCQPGDRILFQHSIPGWGQGGNVTEKVNSVTLRLSEVPAITSGYTASDYWLRLRYPCPTYDEDNSTDVFRLYQLDSRGDSSDPHKVVLKTSLPTSFDVSPNNPTIAPYALGRYTIETKPFRIKSISRTAELELEINAVELDDRIYYETLLSDSTEKLYSELPLLLDQPGNVTNLTLTSGYIFPAIRVSWIKPANDMVYSEARIYYREYSDTDSFTYYYVATVPSSQEDQSCLIENLIPNKKYEVKVVAVGASGQENNTPVTDTKLCTISDYYVNVTKLEIDGQGSDTEFTSPDVNLTWIRQINYGGAGTQDAGVEQTGAGEDYIDKIFQDFVVKVYYPYSSTTPKKTYENNLDTKFSYTQNMNSVDNSGAKRKLKFEVFARDIYNRISQYPATITVENPAPDMSDFNCTLSKIQNGVKVDWSADTSLDDMVDLDGFDVCASRMSPVDIYMNWITPITQSGYGGSSTGWGGSSSTAVAYLQTFSIANIGKNLRDWSVYDYRYVTMINGRPVQTRTKMKAGNTYYVWVYPKDTFGLGIPASWGKITAGTYTTWADVITEYNKYLLGQATWSDVIAKYNAYISAPMPTYSGNHYLKCGTPADFDDESAPITPTLKSTLASIRSITWTINDAPYATCSNLDGFEWYISPTADFSPSINNLKSSGKVFTHTHYGNPVTLYYAKIRAYNLLHYNSSAGIYERNYSDYLTTSASTGQINLGDDFANKIIQGDHVADSTLVGRTLALGSKAWTYSPDSGVDFFSPLNGTLVWVNSGTIKYYNGDSSPVTYTVSERTLEFSRGTISYIAGTIFGSAMSISVVPNYEYFNTASRICLARVITHQLYETEHANDLTIEIYNGDGVYFDGSRLNVSRLSAITANVGELTAGTIQDVAGAAWTFKIDVSNGVIYSKKSGGIVIQSLDGLRVESGSLRLLDGAYLQIESTSGAPAYIQMMRTGLNPVAYIYSSIGTNYANTYHLNSISAGIWSVQDYSSVDFNLTTGAEFFVAFGSAGSYTKKIRVNNTGLHFDGGTPIAKPDITGSKGGNVALGNLLTALANYGLITNSTT